MTSKQQLAFSTDEIILKHLNEESLDINTICCRTDFHRHRVKQSLDRLETQRLVERKNDDDRGYVFALAGQ